MIMRYFRLVPHYELDCASNITNGNDIFDELFVLEMVITTWATCSVASRSSANMRRWAFQ